MDSRLQDDLGNLRALLEGTLKEAWNYLSEINERPAATIRVDHLQLPLPDQGLGGQGALALFAKQYAGQMAANNGPRYLGFVTGGTTPASLMGDWLVSTYDANLADKGSSVAAHIEQETIALLCKLFGLPDDFTGVFVTGATIANFVGLAMGREWVSQRTGHSAAREGLYGLTPIPVLSGAAHSSSYKALAMLGMGRDTLLKVPNLPGREAVDLVQLRHALENLNGAPAIVIGNAGTVNSVDFDDLRGLAALKKEFNFWLHVDAAFGGFAAVSPQYQHLVDGMELADSITIDAHKWMNVPYDAAMSFTRPEHRGLQTATFQNSAAYLSDVGDDPDFFHLTPENSRRFRALPAWFGLIAYGRAGYQEIVERNCATATQLAALIEKSKHFRMVAPVRMNVVCFTVKITEQSDIGQLRALLRSLQASGRAFLTPSNYMGTPCIRAAFSNWRTTPEDVGIVMHELENAFEMALSL